MGRYYSGDIEGKFWFGVQPSNAADRFGGSSGEPSYIEYYFNEDNFELEVLQNLLNTINEKYSKEFTLDTNPDDFDAVASDVDVADVQLGLKIYQCIKEQGDCCFSAEL